MMSGIVAGYVQGSDVTFTQSDGPRQIVSEVDVKSEPATLSFLTDPTFGSLVLASAHLNGGGQIFPSFFQDTTKPYLVTGAFGGNSGAGAQVEGNFSVSDPSGLSLNSTGGMLPGAEAYSHYHLIGYYGDSTYREVYINFTPFSTPEPSALALAGVAAVTVLAWTILCRTIRDTERSSRKR
jgi:hypothetical protein